MKYTIIYEGDVEQMFDEYLDDSGELVHVAGLSFYPSKILKECDPIAYDLYLSDFIDHIAENSGIYVFGINDDQKPTDEDEEIE
jgi:hypothetical protein